MAISVPAVTVNNVPVAIVPNSFKFTLGLGETKVRNASLGAGSNETVHTEDAESQIGKVSFDVYVTNANIRLAAEWKANPGLNVVQGQQRGNSPIALGSASLVNDPEWEASADGVASLEFEGATIPTV